MGREKEEGGSRKNIEGRRIKKKQEEEGREKEEGGSRKNKEGRRMQD